MLSPTQTSKLLGVTPGDSSSMAAVSIAGAVASSCATLQPILFWIISQLLQPSLQGEVAAHHRVQGW